MKCVIDEKTLTDIAMSIRLKKGKYEKISPKNFALEVNEVYDKGRENVIDELRKTLFAEKSGAAVELNDISPVKHGIVVNISNKNLIPFPYSYTKDEYVSNGVTFTINKDSSIKIQGTTTAETYLSIWKDAPLGSTSINAITKEFATNGTVTLSKRLFYNAATGIVSINIIKGETVDEILYPQIEYGTQPTAWVPHLTDLSLVRLIKNGVEYSVNADGTVDGVTSVYPTTTLTTDVGVIINCKYIKAISKAKEEAVIPLIDRSFTKITVPNGANVGNYAFAGCTKCLEYDFSRHTSVPTLGTNAFSGINANAKIIVPGDLYDYWKGVTNWVVWKKYITSKVIMRIDPYTEEATVYIEDIWPYGNFSGVGGYPLKAYYKEAGEEKIEITNDNPAFNFWGFEYDDPDEGGYWNCRFTSVGGDHAHFYPGEWEFWIEDNTGEKLYSRILEVTE